MVSSSPPMSFAKRLTCFMVYCSLCPSTLSVGSLEGDVPAYRRVPTEVVSHADFPMVAEAFVTFNVITDSLALKRLKKSQTTQTP